MSAKGSLLKMQVVQRIIKNQGKSLQIKRYHLIDSATLLSIYILKKHPEKIKAISSALGYKEFVFVVRRIGYIKIKNRLL